MPKETFNFNMLTADLEYTCSNTETLLLPIRMELSKKVKAFCQFLLTFLNLN